MGLKNMTKNCIFIKYQDFHVDKLCKKKASEELDTCAKKTKTDVWRDDFVELQKILMFCVNGS